MSIVPPACGPVVLVLALALAFLGACGGSRAPTPETERAVVAAREPAAARSAIATSPDYALVIHGGAGAPSRDMPADERAAYVAALTSALDRGCHGLATGASALDVVEDVVRVLEDEPLFNAGRGAVFTSAGTHELDASIMDGASLRCGAVAGVRTVKNPITLARAVMERTPHVLLVGDGAEAFAGEIGMQPVPNEYFSTEARRRALERLTVPEHKGTVGVIALDRSQDLAAGTSTGGLTGKRPGRVGDSPLIGAGTYADNRSCAVSCTGTGEEFIRHAVAHAISDRMILLGEDVQTAAETVVEDVLASDVGGVIALSRRGETVFAFNTEAMFRGRCGSHGEPAVWIWEDAE